MAEAGTVEARREPSAERLVDSVMASLNQSAQELAKESRSDVREEWKRGLEREGFIFDPEGPILSNPRDMEERGRTIAALVKRESGGLSEAVFTFLITKDSIVSLVRRRGSQEGNKEAMWERPEILQDLEKVVEGKIFTGKKLGLGDTEREMCGVSVRGEIFSEKILEEVGRHRRWGPVHLEMLNKDGIIESFELLGAGVKDQISESQASSGK